MILLALSTSGRAASAALLKDGVPLAEATRDEGLTHSETILLLAAELLDQPALRPGISAYLPRMSARVRSRACASACAL